MFCRLENIAFRFIWQKAAARESYSHQTSSSSFKPSFHTACWGHCSPSPAHFPFTHEHSAWILTPKAGLFDRRAVRPWPPAMGLYAPVQLLDPARPEPAIPRLAAFVPTHWVTRLHGGKGFCCGTAFTWTHGINPSRNSTSFEWVCQTGGTPLQTADERGMMGRLILRCPWMTMKCSNKSLSTSWIYVVTH